MEVGAESLRPVPRRKMSGSGAEGWWPFTEQIGRGLRMFKDLE